MNQNIVISSRREDPFARVPKSVLNDERMSWKAKGILSYLLGKPTGWKVRVADLVKHSTDGASAVRSALKELRQLGYANLEKERVGGRIVGWVWQISDTPMFLPSSPDRGFPHVENHHLSKNEISKNDLKKSKETREKPARTAPVTPKPDSRAFMKKRPPARFQSNAVFLKWAAAAAPNVCDKRPDVYKEFRKQNWMTRHKKTKKLVPIWNFGEFVLGLEEKLLSAPGGMP